MAGRSFDKLRMPDFYIFNLDNKLALTSYKTASRTQSHRAAQL
jgi:hypothetical protein